MAKTNQGTVVATPTRRELEERLARLEALLSQQSKSVTQENNTSEIRQDEYINVISLCDMRLTLSTLGYGKGKPFSFPEFGSKKRILYSDLVQIIEVHTSFLENGFFYILDPRVIRVHGLDDVYSKLLTKEQIERIIEGKGDVIALYNTANARQKETIQSILINKMIQDPNSVDLNIIDKISRTSGVNLSEKAQESIEFAKIGLEEK